MTSPEQTKLVRRLERIWKLSDDVQTRLETGQHHLSADAIEDASSAIADAQELAKRIKGEADTTVTDRMTTSTFDSLAAMRALEAVGVDRNKAEAYAEQLRVAAGADVGHLASKEDLAGVETALTAELHIVKWAMAFQGAVSLATLAAVLGLAWKAGGSAARSSRPSPAGPIRSTRRRCTSHQCPPSPGRDEDPVRSPTKRRGIVQESAEAPAALPSGGREADIPTLESRTERRRAGQRDVRGGD